MNFIETLKMLKEAGATDDQLHKLAYALIPRSDKPANGSKRLGTIGDLVSGLNTIEWSM